MSNFSDFNIVTVFKYIKNTDSLHLFPLIPVEVEFICIFLWGISSNSELTEFLDNGQSQQFLSRFEKA